MTLHGEIDTVSVFGDILFSDGENTIIENDTFVDSWLAAFIENIDKIKKHDQIEIDVIDEPDLVKIKSVNRELKFIYKKNELTINSIDEFIFQLKEASKKIMYFYDINQDFGKNVQLKIIRDFSIN
jgi:hypothetical protein